MPSSQPPQQPPLGPYKLVTVNSAPERAKRLVGRVCNDVKERCLIVHVGNAEDISQVAALVRAHQPDLLIHLPTPCPLRAYKTAQFTASMWTPAQSNEAIAAAKQICPGIKTFALPQGLQVEKGPDAVVRYIEEHLPALLEN
ncbi:hypothetical protein IWZ00DRAFT_529595 [Phyllosticta capitalensis]